MRSIYQANPLAYIKQVLGADLWAKQAEIAIALTKHQRVFVKASHAVGKCIPLSEAIPMANGVRRTGASILHGTGPKGLHLLSSGRDGHMQPYAAIAEPNGVRGIWKITTESGRTIRRTFEHPLWCGLKLCGNGLPTIVEPLGWTGCSKIEVGMLVACTHRLYGFEHTNRQDEDTLKFIAYMIGDGCVSQGSCLFTQAPGKVIDEFVAISERKGWPCHPIPKSSYGWQISDPANKGKRGTNEAINTLRSWGMLGATSYTHRIPERVFNAPLKQIAVFLSRLYATDGWASTAGTGSGQIGYCSMSHGLCTDIQDLLMRFGIASYIRQHSTNKSWQITVTTPEDILTFDKKIGIYSKDDQVAAVVASVTRGKRRSRGDRTAWRYRNAPRHCRWERVIASEYVGEEDTVAVCVPETSTFFTSFYEHNSFVAASLVNWHFDCFNPSVTITTAPTAKQVTDILWKEIRVQRRGRPGLLPVEPRMYTASNHYAEGYTSAKGDAFQGRHQGNIMLVFDEATGVDGPFWDASEGMMTSPHPLWLTIMNPTDTASKAYEEEASGRWHTITISALDHPNIAAELAGKPAPFPEAVRLAWVADKVNDWCDPIHKSDRTVSDIEWPPHSGTWWRPGPLFEGRVLGRWPTQGSRSVWNEAMWESAMVKQDIEPGAPTMIGCDVARHGDDYTSIVVRRGNVVLHHETHNGWETTHIAGRLKELARAMKAPGQDPKMVDIKIDDAGVGGGVVDQADGYKFSPINSNTKAVDKSGYPNRRSEMWFTVAELAKSGDLDLSRLTPTSLMLMRRQAMAPTWMLDSSGRREVERKENTKKRINRSPDDMDALNLAFAKGRRVLEWS